ncbi:hypothetical protein D3C75_1062540 [compost metagenome]
MQQRWWFRSPHVSCCSDKPEPVNVPGRLIATGQKRTRHSAGSLFLGLFRSGFAPLIQIFNQPVHPVISEHCFKGGGQFTTPVFVLIAGARNVDRLRHVQPVFRLQP